MTSNWEHLQNLISLFNSRMMFLYWNLVSNIYFVHSTLFQQIDSFVLCTVRDRNMREHIAVIFISALKQTICPFSSCNNYKLQLNIQICLTITEKRLNSLRETDETKWWSQTSCFYLSVVVQEYFDVLKII